MDRIPREKKLVKFQLSCFKIVVIWSQQKKKGLCKELVFKV